MTLETTATEIVASMVEAGLGFAIVPLLPSGAVTEGRRIAVVALDAPIRPIPSGALLSTTGDAGASGRAPAPSPPNPALRASPARGLDPLDRICIERTGRLMHSRMQRSIVD